MPDDRRADYYESSLNMPRWTLPLYSLGLALLACNLGGFLGATTATPVALPTLQPNTVDPNYLPGGATAALSTPLPSPTLPPTHTPIPPNLSVETILIFSPGPGSQITGPVTVSGISNPTFENNLVMQVIGEDGSVLGTGNATIQADIGQRGLFEGMVEFTPPAQPRPGRIIVYDSSARDGHIVHLASVEVMVLPAGSTPDLQPAPEHPEDIVITSPVLGDMVSGGAAHVSGFAAPFFEQTLAVQVLDANGALVGSVTLHIQAEAGQPGLFAGDVAYTVTGEQPGSIQVFAASPRDGSRLHLASVEVILRP